MIVWIALAVAVGSDAGIVEADIVVIDALSFIAMAKSLEGRRKCSMDWEHTTFLAAVWKSYSGARHVFMLKLAAGLGRSSAS